MGANAGLKNIGFRQGLYDISSTAKEALGTKRITNDGRIFRYAKAGASALAAGKMGVAAAIDAAHMDETGCIATPIGSRNVTLTVTAGTAIVENQLAGGYLHINDNVGEGYQYPIVSNSAISASGTSIVVTLETGLKVALTTASDFTLVHSPWYGVTESAVEESMPVGVAPVVVTAAYYYWAQTGGVAICLTAGTPAVGANVTLGGVAGSVTGCLNTMTLTSATYTITALHLQPIVGYVFGTAGKNTEYNPIFLTMDS